MHISNAICLDADSATRIATGPTAQTHALQPQWHSTGDGYLPSESVPDRRPGWARLERLPAAATPSPRVVIWYSRLAGAEQAFVPQMPAASARDREPR